MSIKSKLPSDWSLTHLEDMCIPKGLVRGPFGGALKKEFFVELGYKVYEQKNAIYRDMALGDYFVDEKLFSSLKRFAVKPKDFIVSCSGTIGRIFQIPDNAKEGIINQALLKITTNKSIVDDGYFFQYFDWDRFQSKIIDNTQGGAMQNLVGMEIFRKTEIPLPPLPEQKAIAEVLSTADAAIHATEKLIAQKELRKKWLMQQLLTGKKRLKGFEGEWKEVPLGEMFAERNETKYFDLPLLSIGQNGVYPQDESVKKDTSNEDKSKYKRICPGDIGYNTMRMWQGRSALSGLEGIVSPAYTVVTPKKNADSLFFSYLFKMPKMTNLFWRNSQGLVDDTLNCKFKDFSIVKVMLPQSKEEQTAIAQVLQTADKEISLLKAKAEKLREQKTGLMQQLLTGKVRLKIN